MPKGILVIDNANTPSAAIALADNNGTISVKQAVVEETEITEFVAGWSSARIVDSRLAAVLFNFSVGQVIGADITQQVRQRAH